MKEIVDIRGTNQSLNGLDKYNIHKGRSEYIFHPSELERLTKEEAETALDKGVRIGYVSDHTEYHGTHQDEYGYNAVTRKQDLEGLFENHVIVTIDPVYSFSPLQPSELKAKIMDESCVSNNTFFYGREIEVKDGYRKITQEDLDTVIQKENKISSLEIDFEKCHFEKLNFHDQLYGAYFKNSIMEDCIFQGADLVQCNFTNCTINHAQISDTLIRHSRCHEAQIVDSQFQSTCIQDVDFKNSCFKNTKMAEDVIFRGNDFKEVILENTSLKDVKLVDNNYNMDTIIKKGVLAPELRKKLQELETGGHHFLIGKDGKVTVPKEAKRQLSPEELEDVTGYIKDARSQQSQRKEPTIKAPELEA